LTAEDADVRQPGGWHLCVSELPAALVMSGTRRMAIEAGLRVRLGSSSQVLRWDAMASGCQARPLGAGVGAGTVNRAERQRVRYPDQTPWPALKGE
jgi:hypothetical protein